MTRRRQQAKTATFGFEPGDIVSAVMSFGALTPIAVRVVGTDLTLVRQHAEKIEAEMKKISFLRDVGFEQMLDYPSVEVEIDREKAGLSGARVEDVAHALVLSTASTRFHSLNYWVDVKTGFDYLVQLQVPPLRMEKPEDVETLPLQSVNPLVNLMLRDVATVRRGVRPGELDRDMSQRYLTLTANVEGEDMGRASDQVAKAIDAAGEPPRGVRVEKMGQLPPMREMFKALWIGLAVAVFVIFVLLTAYFQSPRLALISVGAVPGVLAGIATILYFTNTSLNIESFMGSIMCLGVSVSNSVMLVTFIDEHWKRGTPSVQAAILGASERLRPILMTACAMTVGMVPMALALEKGSQMQAPLGLAVIGGLVMSTFATLLVVPSIFAVVVGSKVSVSPSVYPDDPESRYYDPLVFATGRSRFSRRPRHSNTAMARMPVIRRRPSPTPLEKIPDFLENPDEPSLLTWRPLMHLELGKTQGAAALALRPLTWRSQMPTAPWRAISNRVTDLPAGVVRSAGCPGSSGLRARREGHRQHRSPNPPPFTSSSPSCATIVRIVGQPSFIESYERSSVYPKMTRLYREMERRHRRPREEGRNACHPVRARTGRGFRDQEGDRQAR